MKGFIKTAAILTALAGLGWAVFYILLPPVLTRRVEACVARDWRTPLDTGKRTEWNSLLFTSKGGFLAVRTAYAHLKGHIHTGVDLQNRRKGGPGEPVYAVAKGKVHDVAVQAQGTRVTVRHLLASGETVYTSYIHVADVRVQKGQWVGPESILARRFNRAELKKYGQFYNHLHFQVHKGRFVREHTVNTETIAAAKERFYDPAFIFKSHHADAAADSAGAVPRRSRGAADWQAWLREKKWDFWELVSFLR